MQEEVENKSVRLAVQTGKVTLKTLLRGLRAWYRHHERKKDVARMAVSRRNTRRFFLGNETIINSR